MPAEAAGPHAPPDPTVDDDGNRPAVSAVVAGTASLILAVLAGGLPTLLVATLFGVAAVALGVAGLRGAARGLGSRGQAVAGIATGSVSLVIAAYVIVGLFVFLSGAR
ncbi:MAG: hypothetical protein ACR2KP_01445 [Egibacteraceae bacterium]